MTDCKPCDTPLAIPYSTALEIPSSFPAAPILPAVSTLSSPTTSPFPYRQAIVSLILLMDGTRPYIAYAGSWLAQYQESPKLHHWTTVKRLLRYISGTQDLGILYSGSARANVEGYSDSDLAGCLESRKSTSGYVLILAGGP